MSADDTEDGRCECRACLAHRCEGPAEQLAVGVEVTLDLCASCYAGHRQDALTKAEEE